MKDIKEAWKPVVGYEGLYEVSDLGRVKSLERVVMRSNGRPFTVRSKMLKLFPYGEYLGVQLHKEMEDNNKLVHVLVAEAFVPNPNNLKYVLRIDGDKMNNNASNLSWSDMAEINYHIVSDKRKDYKKRKPKTTYSPEIINEAKKMLASGMSVNSVFKKTGINRVKLSNLLTPLKD